MGTKPGSTCREGTPIRAVHGCRYTPYISILMKYPSPRTIMFPCYFTPLIFQFADHGKQWLCTFAQITHFSKPVIHFSINIRGIF